MGHHPGRTLLTAVAAVVAAMAGCALAGAPSWGRKMEFAKRLLRNHNYGDLSEQVINQLLDDPSIKGPERAELFNAIGEHHVEAIDSIRGKDALQQCTAHLAEARKYFTKYAEEAKGAGRFEIRKRLAWLSVNLGRVHVRMFEDPDEPKEALAKHKAEAISAYKGAIKEFGALAAEKKAEEDKVRGVAKLKEDAKYTQVRTEHVGVRIYLNDTRVELGKLLKKTGAPPAEWRPLIDAAVKDYKAMLYEFSGAVGLAQLNVKFAEAIVELGPEHDKEALERLDEVWEGRQAFLEHKAVPCKAMHIKAMILRRQKKPGEAVDALDEMIGKRTGSGWEPTKLPIDQVGAKVTDILKNLDEGEIALQYDSRALAESFVLMADAYADRGKAAEDARKPGKEIERFYGMAYEVAVGVWDAKLMPADPKYARLIQLWRVKGRRPLSLTDLNIQIRDLLVEGDKYREKDPPRSRAAYLKAARLYTEVIARTKPEPDQLRKLWDSTARCYYAGGDYYAAHIVFTGLARWSLRPQPPHAVAYGFAKAAVEAIRAQYDRSVREKAGAAQISFEKKVLGEANLFAESLSVLGPDAWTVDRARQLRGEKKLEEARQLLLKVRPESRVYALALHELALVYREMFLDLPKDERAAPAGQRLLKTCLDAFQSCLDFVKKKLPEVKGDEAAEERRRLLDAAAASLVIFADTLLKDFVNQPARVLELTGSPGASYPGIDSSMLYPRILYSRVHAAYVVVTARATPPADRERALTVIDDTWKKLKEFPDFRYLFNACKMGAMAYIDFARYLEEQAKKGTGPAKADLAKRAAAARDRALDFYLELLTLAPHQPLDTYRYVLYQLDRRVHDPKSADWRLITGIAPKALELFGRDEASLDELSQVRIILGSAQCSLRNWREGIAVLEEVDRSYEPDYQKRMKIYEERKKWAEENEKQPPRLPVRHTIHAHARELLGRAYIESKAKLNEAKAIFAEQVRSFSRRESPKYWEGMSFLCEATRLTGEHEDVTRYLFVIAEAITTNPVTTGKGSPKDFLDLATKVEQEVAALQDAALKGKLLPTLNAAIEKLKEAVNKGDKR